MSFSFSRTKKRLFCTFLKYGLDKKTKLIQAFYNRVGYRVTDSGGNVTEVYGTLVVESSNNYVWILVMALVAIIGIMGYVLVSYKRKIKILL